MTLKRAVVTGLGAITPLGNDVKSLWDGLVSGKSGAAPITRFDTSKFKTTFACEVRGFNPEDYLDRKEARKTDLFTQYALAASDQAIQDAGVSSDTMNPGRIGVVWGSGVGGIKTFEEEIIGYVEGGYTPRFNPFFIPKMIVDITPGHISIRHGFMGPNYTTVSACASSTTAIVNAFNYIRLGKADIIIAGGSEAAVTAAGMGGFSAVKALSTRNDSPETASRPFDKDRDGFVLGEGGCALVIEEYEHARKRGAKIYAELIGGGMSADAYHITAPHPEGKGAVLVMKDVLNDAGINPEDVGYINVHGTSTQLGDLSEVAAIQKVFRDHAYDLNISSTKSMTGHLLGAAGAIEAITVIKSLEHQIIPPTINHFTDDEAFDSKLNFTFNAAQDKKYNIAVSNTFGFGGHNFSAAFKRFQG